MINDTGTVFCVVFFLRFWEALILSGIRFFFYSSYFPYVLLLLIVLGSYVLGWCG